MSTIAPPGVSRWRRPDRLPGWDYSNGGAYFLTMLTQHKAKVLSRIVSGRVILKPVGRIVADAWMAVPWHNHGLTLDSFVIMPDHFHALIFLDGSSLALGRVVNLFKGGCTRAINELRGTTGEAFWQRGFHDWIVRDDRALHAIRRYIDLNPVRWRS